MGTAPSLTTSQKFNHNNGPQQRETNLTKTTREKKKQKNNVLMQTEKYFQVGEKSQKQWLRYAERVVEGGVGARSAIDRNFVSESLVYKNRASHTQQFA